MVDKDKSLSPEEREQIINGIKSLGKLSGVMALLFIYTPKRIFGLFGKLAKLFSIKTVIGYEALKKVVNKNGSKAINILSNASQAVVRLLWRWVKISLIVLSIYSIITIIGLLLQSSFLIALIGIITAIYFLVVCYILEKGIMAIFATYDIGKELLLDILHIPKSVLDSFGISLRQHQNIISEERIRDTFHDLRFASVVVANVSFLLALFPYWSWVGALSILGIGALGLALLHFWQPSWTPTFWTWFRRLSTFSLIFLVLIFAVKSGAEYFYPETMKALMTAQSNNDRKYAKELLSPPKPVEPKVITKIVEKVVIKEKIIPANPKVIAIPTPQVISQPVVKQVVIPQVTEKVDNSFADRLKEAAILAKKAKDDMTDKEADNDHDDSVAVETPKKTSKKKMTVAFTERHFVLNSNIKPQVISIPR